MADKLLYTSPWYAGSSRIMVGFGCTRAPYYPRDPTCPGAEGRHHGIDMALACGTPLYAGVRGTVVGPGSGGRLGAAYGPWAFRIRTTDQRYDIVIGHVRTVFVRAGDVIEPHQRIALASDAGAPDGCHLHFEVRPAAASYTAAINPRSLLDLTPTRETTR